MAMINVSWGGDVNRYLLMMVVSGSGCGNDGGDVIKSVMVVHQ